MNLDLTFITNEKGGMSDFRELSENKSTTQRINPSFI